MSKQSDLRKDGPSAAARIRVMKRDRFRCTYCGAPGTDVELEIDHIIPVTKGGSHHMSNLTTACRKCNQDKGDTIKQPTINMSEYGRSGAVGLYLHTKKDGNIHWQGVIIGKDGDFFLVQIFEWLGGSPTLVKAIPRDVIFSEECDLYADAETMNYHWERYNKRLEQQLRRDQLRMDREQAAPTTDSTS